MQPACPLSARGRADPRRRCGPFARQQPEFANSTESGDRGAIPLERERQGPRSGVGVARSQGAHDRALPGLARESSRSATATRERVRPHWHAPRVPRSHRPGPSRRNRDPGRQRHRATGASHFSCNPPCKRANTSKPADLQAELHNNYYRALSRDSPTASLLLCLRAAASGTNQRR